MMACSRHGRLPHAFSSRRCQLLGSSMADRPLRSRPFWPRSTWVSRKQAMLCRGPERTTREVLMQWIRIVAAGISLAALVAAGAIGAEEKALGTRIVDQMNALYSAHPGVRANH